MLGRSANGIFWMFRYLERAKNTARLLQAGFRLAMTRGAGAGRDEWRSLLITIGQDAFYQQSGGDYAGQSVIEFILRDPANPGNILNMIEMARANARSVRTVITREVWEATNESWMVLRDMLSKPVSFINLGDILSIIRRQSTLVRGSMSGTMLRNDIYNFAKAGIFIERADNTARILDVKYYVLLPSISWVGSGLDNAQWEGVLRSVAGERAYRWLNAGAMDSRGIAEFLILDGRFPRSLLFCMQKLKGNIASIDLQYGEVLPANIQIQNLAMQLEQTSIETIFEEGLHEFIGNFLTMNKQITNAISTDYRFID